MIKIVLIILLNSCVNKIDFKHKGNELENQVELHAAARFVEYIKEENIEACKEMFLNKELSQNKCIDLAYNNKYNALLEYLASQFDVSKSDNGKTLLMLALEKNDIFIIQDLLREPHIKNSINAQDDEGNTALF